MKKPELNDQAKRFAELLHRSKRITVLTGAGISTSCGIPDFRGPKGLYVTKKYDADTVFDIEHFRKDPGPFYEFARDFINLESTLKPSAAHLFLAKLERRKNFRGLITQNIDSLHQKAGSRRVLEIHGSFYTSSCLECPREYSYTKLREFLAEDSIPKCEGCGGVIKPDIVFFGENVKDLQDAVNLSADSDLFVIIGTSCVVYPAAGLPRYAGGNIAVVNLQDVKLPLMNVAITVKEDLDEFFTRVEHYWDDP